MINTHVHDELSEYVDGQSGNDARIARHLQSCPTCARRHMELLKLSSALKQLPAPECDPAFATRVTAQLRQRPRVRRRQRMPLAWAWAAAALVIAALALWQWTPDAARVQTAGPVRPETRLDLSWQDDERVVAEFRRLMDAGVDLQLFADPVEAGLAGEPALFEAPYDAPDPGATWDDAGPGITEEVGDVLDALSDEEMRILDRALGMYENGV